MTPADMVGPPPDWDADEAAERIRARAHARVEHLRWLTQTNDDGERVNRCDYCEEAHR